LVFLLPICLSLRRADHTAGKSISNRIDVLLLAAALERNITSEYGALKSRLFFEISVDNKLRYCRYHVDVLCVIGNTIYDKGLFVFGQQLMNDTCERPRTPSDDKSNDELVRFSARFLKLYWITRLLGMKTNVNSARAEDKYCSIYTVNRLLYMDVDTLIKMPGDKKEGSLLREVIYANKRRPGAS
jgi:hypothetical protein